MVKCKHIRSNLGHKRFYKYELYFEWCNKCGTVDVYRKRLTNWRNPQKKYKKVLVEIRAPGKAARRIAR